jgi:hypothetical protein
MINKYILLDEIELEVIRDHNNMKLLFNNREEAVSYGELNETSWQVIEIPFGDC